MSDPKLTELAQLRARRNKIMAQRAALKAELRKINRLLGRKATWVRSAAETCPCCGLLQARQFFVTVAAGEPAVCRQCSKAILADKGAAHG